MNVLKEIDIKVFQTVVRLLLWSCLIYAVYGETGAWTAIALSLVLLGSEIQNIINKATIFSLNQIKNIIN